VLWSENTDVCHLQPSMYGYV